MLSQKYRIYDKSCYEYAYLWREELEYRISVKRLWKGGLVKFLVKQKTWDSVESLYVRSVGPLNILIMEDIYKVI